MLRYRDFRMGKIKEQERSGKVLSRIGSVLIFFLQSLSCRSYFNVRIETLNLFVKNKISINTYWRRWHQEF